MFNESKIPTMLKITEIADMYGLPVHFVRALVNNGEVVSTRVGNKILVNAERFADYLNTNTICSQADKTEYVCRLSAKSETNHTERKPRIHPINKRK